MKNSTTLLSTLLLLIIVPSIHAQIGIGTLDPKAILDIPASDPDDPQAVDGILIPRINSFPTENLTADQDGMMVFLNAEYVLQNEETEDIIYSRGFYYWNNAHEEWVLFKSAENKSFYVEGTTEMPLSISDDIFREGRVSFGEESDKGQLNAIVNDNSENLTAKPKTALYVKNSHPSEGSSYVTYGIDVLNESSVNGKTYGLRLKNSTGTTDEKYGIHSQVTGSGYGIHYGIYNETNQESGSSSDMYGIKNLVGKTNGAESFNYGIHTQIGGTTSAGTIYGLYSKAEGNASATVYAGYFLGDVSIGSTDEDNYILPSARGNESEVLVSGSNGETYWQTNSTRPFETVSEATTLFVVTQQMSTIRITAEVDELSLPDPSHEPGKIFTLINASNTDVPFDDSVDFIVQEDVADTEITSIVSHQRLMIQSDGSDWIVIGN